MSKNPSLLKRLNLRVILKDVITVGSVIAAILFALLWRSAENEASNAVADKKLAVEQVTTLSTEKTQQEQEVAKISELLDNNKDQKKKTHQDLENKDSKITQLRKDIENIKHEQLANENLWRAPLIETLEITQDIYAMKWDSNSHVLSDMENHSARTVTICNKWEELCKTLAPYPHLAPQVAKLRIRLAQAYSGLGLVGRINFDTIDWKAAGMEAQRPEIEAHVWYSVATQFSKIGKPDHAQKYLTLAKAAAASIPIQPKHSEKADYYQGMIHLLEANLAASHSPDQALKSYVLACEKLSNVVTALPTNTKIRTAFIQACLDGSLLSQGDSSAGQSEQLRKQAYKQIAVLLAKHPKIDKPHILYAKIKTQQAEDLIREGEHQKASQMLKSARAEVKKGGGDLLITAAIDGTQAFIHWDHGERTKAMAIINSAIDRVKKLKAEEPNNHDATYRLATLLWVRSSMRISPSDAILDGQEAVKSLVELVQKGAGKHEASARRMIAIIYGDIGHQAYSSKQSKVAKQYFQQAKNQWSYLIKHWGSCDEYKEGERWCSWRIKSL